MNKFLKPLRVVLTMLLIMSTPVLGKEIKSPLSAKQIDVLNTVYDIGKNIRADDGMTFEWAGVGITFSESSAGKNLIGDRSPDFKLAKASLGSMQVRVKTAKCVIKHDKFMKKHFEYLLKPRNERFLISLLLSDVEFSALVGITYLKLNYNSALKRGIKNPYFYCISRYNGGAHNYPYYNKVMANIKRIKKWKAIEKFPLGCP